MAKHPPQAVAVWLGLLSNAETQLSTLQRLLTQPESSQALTAQNYQAMLQLTSVLQQLGASLPKLNVAELATQHNVAQRLAELEEKHKSLAPQLVYWQQQVEKQQQHVAKQRQQQQAYKCQ